MARIETASRHAIDRIGPATPEKAVVYLNTIVNFLPVYPRNGFLGRPSS